MADGFLGRWARRKEAVRKGEEVPPEPQRVVVAEPPSPRPSPASGKGSDVAALAPTTVQEQAPPPTLEDANALTPDSDFTRFVRPDVAPDVRNAAVKKLFADPHFNVMDGLDVYIDDYNKPDPIPEAMARQLASFQFLDLFQKEEEAKEKDEEQRQQQAAGPAGNAPTVREVADDQAPQTVAQSGNPAAQALPPAQDHADPDLRLQQDDAPGPESPGAGAR